MGIIVFECCFTFSLQYFHLLQMIKDTNEFQLNTLYYTYVNQLVYFVAKFVEYLKLSGRNISDISLIIMWHKT